MIIIIIIIHLHIYDIKNNVSNLQTNIFDPKIGQRTRILTLGKSETRILDN